MDFDLKKFVGMEEIPETTYYTVEGGELVIPGKRFPIGKAAAILQEFTSVAKTIKLGDHWKAAMDIAEVERQRYNENSSLIGPMPEEPDPALLDKGSELFNPQKYEALQNDYELWYRKFMSIPTPRSMIAVLQEQLIPEFINLIDVAPEAVFKLVAYTVLDWKTEIVAHRDAGTLGTLINNKVQWCEDNLDLVSVAVILSAMVKLVGIETFFKILPNLLNNNRTTESTTPTTEETPTPIRKTKAK